MDKLIHENGYWLINDKNFNEHYFDKNLSSGIISYLKSENCKTILDIGCGNGLYVKNFNESGFNSIGYDGNPNTSEITNNLCGVMNFAKKCNIPKNDWVICLEVGEHIPKKYEDILIDNIVNSAKDGIIISWAVPNQPGYGHINCQTNSYIKDKLKKLGFINDPISEKTLRNKSTLDWFKNTIMVFKKYKPVFDFDAQDTGHNVDPIHHMMLGMCYLWSPNCDKGKGDAIGRTFDAYYVYRDERFIEAIKKCWVKVPTKMRNGHIKDYYWQGYRYPSYAKGLEEEPVGLSRDHTLYTVLAFMESGMSEKELKEFITHIPWKISKSFSMTPDLWLWFRARVGIKWAKVLSPILDILITSLYVVQNKLIYLIAPFSEESSQDEFKIIRNEDKPKRLDKMSSWLFPTYAIVQTAWKTSYMKPGISKSIMEWLLLKIIPKHNYVARMLVNDKNMPTREQVYSYKAMMGGRWTAILNPYINDRDLHIITKEQYPNYDALMRANNLEVDMVRVLYEQKNN